MPLVSALGIDFGTRRIGIAVSTSFELATPHSVIRYEGDLATAVEKIARVAAELESTLLVLGVPSGGRRDAAQIEEKFGRLAAQLRERTGIEVVLWDETLSTAEAASKRRESGKDWRRYRDEIDKEAAAVILQSYLDERSRRSQSQQ